MDRLQLESLSIHELREMGEKAGIVSSKKAQIVAQLATDFRSGVPVQIDVPAMTAPQPQPQTATATDSFCCVVLLLVCTIFVFVFCVIGVAIVFDLPASVCLICIWSCLLLCCVFCVFMCVCVFHVCSLLVL